MFIKHQLTPQSLPYIYHEELKFKAGLPVWIHPGELHKSTSISPVPPFMTTAGGMDEESFSSLVCGLSKKQVQTHAAWIDDHDKIRARNRCNSMSKSITKKTNRDHRWNIQSNDNFILTIFFGYNENLIRRRGVWLAVD